jgi:hypothetical protein
MLTCDRGVDTSRGLYFGTALAAATLLAGLAALLAYSVAEAATNPGYSIVDAYWVGRLPWMGIIEGMVVGGATACVLIGTATVIARGGWLRQAIVLLPVGAAAFWWFLAFIRAGMSVGPCIDCLPPPFDPWAYAYSAPDLAFLMLLLPAVIIALLALTIREPHHQRYISPS